jgi:hypothetical protein
MIIPYQLRSYLPALEIPDHRFALSLWSNAWPHAMLKDDGDEISEIEGVLGHAKIDGVTVPNQLP